MADTPLPPQITTSPDLAPVAPVLPTGNGIVPAGVNGLAAHTGTREAQSRDLKVGPTFAEWVTEQATYAAILAGVWIVAAIALNLYGFHVANALGFATIITLIAAFFVRSLFPLSHEKVQAASSEKLQSTDSFREVIDTVVFVVVLVLMLKSFSAEAFVIPTGSMAPTLWGYQKVVKCIACEHEFPVNCSSEVDPTDGSPKYVDGCVCPNCRKQIVFIPPPSERERITTTPSGANYPDPGWNSGDRVLVAKFLYDLLQKNPNRLDVVVFKYPGEGNRAPDEKGTFPADSGPVKKHVPMNYIKRLIGLPGETIAICRGKVFVLSADKGLQYDDFEKAAGQPDKLTQLWQFMYMHHEYIHRDDPNRDDPNKSKVRIRWDKGEFEIIRKPPEVMLAMMRLVYDNDQQAKDLKGPEYQRWVPADAWSARGANAFAHDGAAGGTQWLRYRHVLRGSPDKPQLITDFTAYNTWHASREEERNWASDLAIECQVQVEKPEGTFTLELSRGKYRYQANFDVASGTCTLDRIELKDDGSEEKKTLDSKPSRLKGKGTYQVRFANIDDRLAVWGDDKLVFGDGVAYTQEPGLVPVKENDLDRPVSIGSQGARIVVSKLKVLRDTYYTTNRGGRPDVPDVPEFRADDPLTWKHYAAAPVSTYYVQPEHFLCMGDNSPESSDGRSWGLVPKRLMLGRALLVYYPFSRAGRIH